MTKEQFVTSTIEAGIYTADGNLPPRTGPTIPTA